MAKFEIGDLVVLKSGSMRMAVEAVAEDGTVETVWCNEGVIGRDRFSAVLLNKWEHREETPRHRGAPRGKPFGGEREGGGRPFRGDREGGGKPFRGGAGGGGGGDRERGGDRDGDRPQRRTGWDGKPREKKFYRKDG